MSMPNSVDAIICKSYYKQVIWLVVFLVHSFNHLFEKKCFSNVLFGMDPKDQFRKKNTS